MCILALIVAPVNVQVHAYMLRKCFKIVFNIFNRIEKSHTQWAISTRIRYVYVHAQTLYYVFINSFKAMHIDSVCVIARLQNDVFLVHSKCYNHS